MSGILATPEVKPPANYALMRALDGRSYQVRSRAALRVACADLSILVYDVSRTLDRCISLANRATDDSVKNAAIITGLSAQQTLGGLCVLLGGSMQQLGIARWSDVRPRRLGSYSVRFEDGRTTTIDSPARLEEYGAGFLEEATERLEQFSNRDTMRVNLPTVEPIEVSGLGDMGNPLLIAATPLFLGVVRIIAGIIVTVIVVRAAQQLLFPEAAGRARAHEASIDAIERSYRRTLDTCADLPTEQQAACRQEALVGLLNAVDRANETAGESAIDKVIRIVAIGAGSAVALKVLTSSFGRRRGFRGR